MNEMNKE